MSNSQNIDERILSMQFNKRGFEKGIKSTTKLLDDFEEKLKLEGAGEGLDELKDTISDFSDSANESLGGVFEGLAETATGVAEKIKDVFIYKLGSDLYDWGKGMVKTLSVDQITAGLSKYEEQTKSSFTIMNATGKSVKDVDAALERLMWFSDETSYSFTDMVDNVGKFTSQNIDLDVSIKAMQGIATAAALAGQGTGEASRAMYNFAQSLAQGSVKLMDWKSIENANMATAEFKETIIETAKEVGTLNKQTSKTKKGTLVTAETFSATLSEAWFTSDVLIKALEKYGGYADKLYEYVNTHDVDTASQAMREMGAAGDELGMRAFKAAQEARTFTDAIEATKDAVSSGWMQSFKLIIGNTSEATVLFTDLANALWEVFAGGSEARNELLKGWRDAGGRERLLKGIYDALEGIWNMIRTVTDALKSAFPEMTVERLLNITDKVAAFGTELKNTLDILTKIRQITQETVGKKLKIDWDFGESIKQGMRGENVKHMQEELMELGYDVGSAGADGIFGPQTQKALDRFQKEYKLAASGVYDDATHYAIGRALWGEDEFDVKKKVEKEYTELAPFLQQLENIFTGVSSAAHIFWEALSSLWTIGTHLVAAFAPLGDVLLDIIESIAGDVTELDKNKKTANFFVKLIEAADVAIAALASVIQVVADIIRAFFFGPEGIENGNEHLMNFAIWIQSIKDSIRNSKIGKWFLSLGDKFTEFVDNVKSKGYLATVKDWLVKAWEDVKTYFSSGQAQKDVMSVLSGIGGIFSSLFANVLEFIVTGGKNREDMSEEEIKAADEKIQQVYAVVDTLKTKWEEVKAAAVGVSEFLFGKDEEITRGRQKGEHKHTAGFFENAWTWMTDAWNLIAENEKIQAAIDGATSFFVGIYEFLFGKDEEITRGGRGEQKGEHKHTPGWFEQAGEWMATTWDLIAENEGIQAAIDGVKSFFVGVYEFLFGKDTEIAHDDEGDGTKHAPGWFEKAWTWIHETWQLITENEAIQAAAQAISNFFTGDNSIWKRIGEWFTNFFTSISEFVHNIFSKDSNEADEASGKIEEKSEKSKTVLDTVKSWGEAIMNFLRGTGKVTKGIGEWLPFLIGLGAMLAIFFAVFNPIIRYLTSIQKTKQLQITKGNSLIKTAGSIALFAAAVALIAGSLYVIGEMSWGNIGKAGIVVVGIFGLLFGMLALTKHLKIDGKSLFLSMGALLILAGVIAVLTGVMWLLAQIPANQILKGGLLLVGFMGVLFLFIFGLNKIKSTNLRLSGMIGLAAAIAILVPVVAILGLLPPELIWKGIAALGGILLLVAGFIILVTRFGKMQQGFKITGIVLLAAAVAILAGLAILLGVMPPKLLWRGIGAVTVLMILVGAFYVLIPMIAKNNNVRITGLIGLAAAITMLGALVILLGLMPPRTLWKGIGAVAILVLLLGGLYSMVAFMSMGKHSKKIKMGPVIAIAGVIAALMGVVALVALIPTDRLWAAIAAIGAIVASITVIAALIIAADKLGVTPGKMIKGSAGLGVMMMILAGMGVIFTAVLGAIDDLMGGNLVSRIQRGGKVLKALKEAMDPFIGTLEDLVTTGAIITIATAVGSIPGGPVAAIAGSLGISLALDILLGNSTAILVALDWLDEHADLQERIEGGGVVLYALGRAIDQFRMGITDGIMISIQKFGDTFENFRADLTGLGQDYDENGFDRDIAVAKQIFSDLSKFFVQNSNEVERDTHDNEQTVYDELTHNTDLVSGSIGTFGDAMKQFRAGVDGIDSSSITADTTKAKEIATTMSSFFSELTPYATYPISDTMPGTYYTAPGQLANDMLLIGNAFTVYRHGIDGITAEGSTIEQDSDLALSIIGNISTFFDGLTGEENRIKSTAEVVRQEDGKLVAEGLDPVGILCAHIDSMVASFDNYKQSVLGITSTTIVEDTATAIQILKDVSAAFSDIAQEKITVTLPDPNMFGPTVSNTKQSQTGEDDPIQQLFDHMDSLGQTMWTYKLKLQGLSYSDPNKKYDTDVKEDTDKAIEVLEAVAAEMNRLTTANIEIEDTGWGAKKTKFNTVVTGVGLMGENVSRAAGRLAHLGDKDNPILADMTTAIHIIGQVASLTQTISQMDIETSYDTSWWADIFTSQERTSFQEVINNLGLIDFSPITNKDNKKGIIGLSKNNFQDDFNVALGTLSSLANVMVEVHGLLASPLTSDEGLELGNTVDTYGAELGLLQNALGNMLFYIGQINSDDNFKASADKLHTVEQDISALITQIGSMGDIRIGENGPEATFTSPIITTIKELGTALAGDDVSGSVRTGIKAALSPIGEEAGYAGADIGQTLLGFIEKLGPDILQGDYAVGLITTAASSIPSTAVSTLNSYYSSFKRAGEYAAEGYARGLSNTQWARDAARQLALAAQEELNNENDAHSPSKVYEKSGMWASIGYANGISEYSYMAEKAAGSMATDSFKTIQNSIATLSTALAEDIDTTPTIRPVLDLSDINSGASTLNGLLSGHQFKVGTSVGIAKEVASNTKGGMPAANGNHDIVLAISKLREDVSSLKEGFGGLQVVMDSGALVGSIGNKMDAFLGRKAAREKRRG